MCLFGMVLYVVKASTVKTQTIKYWGHRSIPADSVCHNRKTSLFFSTIAGSYPSSDSFSLMTSYNRQDVITASAWCCRVIDVVCGFSYDKRCNDIFLFLASWLDDAHVTVRWNVIILKYEVSDIVLIVVFCQHRHNIWPNRHLLK